MIMSKISNEYAKALFALAKEENSEKDYEDALGLVDNMLNDNPGYIELLLSPKIPLDERHKIIDEAFLEVLPKNILSFLKLLCDKGHLRDFGSCVAEYRMMVNALTRLSEARVTTAIELSEAQKEALKAKLKKLSGNEVELLCVVDKSIIGGMVVEMDGKIIDKSIERHLKKVKDVISK